MAWWEGELERPLVAEVFLFHARDLRLLLLDRLAERHLAGRLLAAPVVPRALEEARAAGLDVKAVAQPSTAEGLVAAVETALGRSLDRPDSLVVDLAELVAAVRS